MNKKLTANLYLALCIGLGSYGLSANATEPTSPPTQNESVSPINRSIVNTTPLVKNSSRNSELGESLRNKKYASPNDELPAATTFPQPTVFGDTYPQGRLTNGPNGPSGPATFITSTPSGGLKKSQ